MVPFATLPSSHPPRVTGFVSSDLSSPVLWTPFPVLSPWTLLRTIEAFHYHMPLGPRAWVMGAASLTLCAHELQVLHLFVPEVSAIGPSSICLLDYPESVGL